VLARMERGAAHGDAWRRSCKDEIACGHGGASLRAWRRLLAGMEEIAGPMAAAGLVVEHMGTPTMLCCHYLGGIGWIWGTSALSRPSACAHVGVYPHPYQVASQFQ